MTLVVGLCFLFVLTPMLARSSVTAAPPEFTVLEYAYGSEGNEIAYAVIEVSSGGFVIAGHTQGPPSYDTYLYVVRTDAEGALLWEYTREAPGVAVGSDIIECHDGGFAITGFYQIPPSYGDMLLVKLNANGQFDWEHTYGDNDAAEWAFAVVQLETGGFVLAGSVSGDSGNMDMFLVGTNELGNQLWEQQYGGPDTDEARAIILTRDGNLAIAGRYGGYGSGGGQMWLMITNTAGYNLLDVVYPEFENSWAYAIVECVNGDLALAGSTWSFSPYDWDYALLRTNIAGDVQWAYSYERETYDYCYSLVETSEGDFVLAGYTNYFDLLLIGTDADGNKQWEFSYGDYFTAYALSIVNCRTGGFAITGGKSELYLSFDIWLLRLFVETPSIEGLIEDVETLETDGLLNQGQTNSLVQKLEVALQLQEQGQLTAACNLLQSFIEQVEAYLSAGILTEMDAQPLIEYATTLINEICQA